MFVRIGVPRGFRLRDASRSLQLGTVSGPKTANPDHMRSTAEVDFIVTNEDMAVLEDLAVMDIGEHRRFPVCSGN